MICPKCNAVIPDGSTICPECDAHFEVHVSSFAGSVHWEDAVIPAKSEREKKKIVITGCILLAFVLAFALLYQTRTLTYVITELQWFIRRLRYPTA